MTSTAWVSGRSSSARRLDDDVRDAGDAALDELVLGPHQVGEAARGGGRPARMARRQDPVDAAVGEAVAADGDAEGGLGALAALAGRGAGTIELEEVARQE